MVVLSVPKPVTRKRKLSLTLDAAEVEELRSRSGAAGLSSAVNLAVTAEVRRMRRAQALDLLLDDLIRQHGRPSPRLLARYEAVWDRP